MSKQDVIAAQSAYDAALATYEAFRKEHMDIIEEHDHLAVLLGEAIEALKNALRENHTLVGKNFGSFKVSVPREYDAEVLKKLLGSQADDYLKVKYMVDSRAFEDAVAKGRITRTVADQVVTTGSPRITGGPKAPSIFER